MKVFFATWLEDPTLGVTMTETGADRRLVSYHFLAAGLKAGKLTNNSLKRYIKTGKESNSGQKRASGNS